ncbi:hypothetical protein GCM10007881_44310 [Mesorhizobium huakuii]|uniref:helix-turn-helix domain-containing protein n=1 Tax=Mesorhizobium huakuii TaxID=28104 RepID=UPI00235C9E8D|nr:helix-turn-helix transcriptional regulator [Mesorhizobium huakuii]GLQ80910.1 hypothetical protein GCM10007881_44310 [Mesorhizobium huakuii]
MTSTKRYGNTSIASRLAEARLAAGYTSMQQAAAAIGVPIGTYKSHERGIRSVGADALEKYAQSFDVDAAWLRSGATEGNEGPTLPHSSLSATGFSASVNGARTTMAIAAGNRLKIARILADFGSAAAASRHFGWAATTYVQHESGIVRFDADWATLYGLAFGVEPPWLLGEAGSTGSSYLDSLLQRPGLQDGVSRKPTGEWHRTQTVDHIIPELKLLSEPARRGASKDVTRLLKWQASKRRREQLLARPNSMTYATEDPFEYRNRGHEEQVAARVWGLPTDFLRRRGANPDFTTIISSPEDCIEHDIRRGDLLVIDAAQRTLTSGLFLVERGGDPALRLVLDVSDDLAEPMVIGKVVASIR